MTGPETNSAVAPPVTLAQVFMAFLKIGLSGFGSTVVHARRLMVEQWRWLSAAEFDDIWARCQALPGANVVNWSVCVGARFHGASGSVVAVLGIIGAPVLIVMLLGWMHSQYGNRPEIQAMLRGVSPVVAGLIFSTATKMAMGPRLRSWMAVFPLLSFGAVVLAKLPLATVLGVGLPLAIAAAWYRERRAARGEA